jgi:hypothetical protein
MLQIADRVVTEEELVFPRGPRVYLGHNATFERCRLHFNSRADCVTLARSRFVDCDIYADRPMKKALWTACDVIGCRFHGRFQDNDFGHWPGFWLSGMTGSIADCDFTDAELHFIRFFGCDITSLQLPGWPCFTLVDPRQAFEPIGRMAGPPEWLAYFDAIHGEMARQEDPCLTAMTYHAPTLAKWLSRKVRVTEADLRAFVEGYSGAVL